MYYYINTKGARSLGKGPKEKLLSSIIYIYPSSFGEIYKNKVENGYYIGRLLSIKTKEGNKKYGSCWIQGVIDHNQPMKKLSTRIGGSPNANF